MFECDSFNPELNFALKLEIVVSLLNTINHKNLELNFTIYYSTQMYSNINQFTSTVINFIQNQFEKKLYYLRIQKSFLHNFAF